MAQIGNKCPGLQEYHTFKEGHCLTGCDHQCVPASVLVHIANRQRVDKHIGQYLSVTSLLGCNRQLYSERTMDYFVEPPKSWWSLRGSILHRLLENPGLESLIEDARREVHRLMREGVADREEITKRWLEVELKMADLVDLLPKREIPNWQSETEYELPLGIYNGKERFLRGTIDVLRPETGELYDYKTIGDKGLGVIKNGAKEDHIKQFNMYRLMIERGYPLDQRETYKPITIKKITAFYMTMMQIARTGGMLAEVSEWRKSDPPEHPNLKIVEKLSTKEELALKKGKRHENAVPDDYTLEKYHKFRTTFAIPEIPLLPLDEVHKFVMDTAPILIEAFESGKMPDMCPPEMRAWKCDGYCPDQIRNACDAYNDTVGVKRVVAVDKNIPVEVAA
jgi:hypothetical protein